MMGFFDMCLRRGRKAGCFVLSFWMGKTFCDQEEMKRWVGIKPDQIPLS